MDIETEVLITRLETEIIDLKIRHAETQRELRHFHRQFAMLIHQVSHDGNLIQSNVWELSKLLGRPAESECQCKARIKKESDVTVQCFICGADLVISKEDYEIADVGTNPIACWKHADEGDVERRYGKS